MLITKYTGYFTCDLFSRLPALLSPSILNNSNPMLRFVRLLAAFVLCGILIRAVTFSDWQAVNFTSGQLADASVSGVTVDPDTDGMANLHEYVFFGAPLASESNLAPTLEQVGNAFTLTYRERHDIADVDIRLQGSDTLMNWVTYNTMIEADRVTFTGYDEVTLVDPGIFDGTRRFLRLRLELTPVLALRAPTQLMLTVVTPAAWMVSWTDPNTAESGYAVERQNPTSGGWDRLTTLGADIGTWSHASADYQTSMTYRVVSLGASGEEMPSDPITLADTDGDGIPNALELSSAYTGLTGTYASDPNQFSTTGSGVSDGWLAANGFDPAAEFDGEADTDGDGLTDAEEAARGTAPRDMDGDTDNDGVLDPNDGWPRHAWITAAPLPEVRYAVVRLSQMGWPADAEARRISDAGDVVGQHLEDGWYPTDWIMLKSGEPQPIEVLGRFNSPLPQADMDAFAAVAYPVVSWPFMDDSGSFSSVYGFASSKEEYVAMPILNLGKDGSISKARWNGQTIEGVVIDKEGTAIAFPPIGGFSAPLDGTHTIYASNAVATNRLGDTLTVELGGFNNYYDGMPVDSTYERYAMVSYIRRANGIDEKIGDAYFRDVYAFDGDIQGGGVTLLPYIINDERSVAGRVFSKGTTNWILGVWNNGVIHPFPSLSRLSGLTSPSPGVPAIIAGVNSTNSFIWWSKENNNWVSRLTSLWDPAMQTGTDHIDPFFPVIMNDRLEIINGLKLIRNGVVLNLQDKIPTNWALSGALDINNHGVILANATRTLDDQGQPITDPQPEPVLLMPFDIVRKNETGDYVSINNIPMMRAGDGIERGKASSSDTVSKVFSLKVTPLDDQVEDTISFLTENEVILLSETTAASRIFESANGSIQVAISSPVQFNPDAYDTFSIIYTNSEVGAVNETVIMGETEESGVFRALQFTLWLTFQPTSTSNMEVVISPSETPVTLMDNLLENASVPGLYENDDMTIAFRQPANFSPSAVDVIEVIFTSLELFANQVTLRLTETSADSREFTNQTQATVIYSDEPSRVPSETVEVFRIRRYASTTEDTFQMTVRSATEDVLVTLTRTQGGEFLSEPMIAVNEGDDISLIPNSTLYRTIQVLADAQEATKEIRFIDNALNIEMATKNTTRTAYIAHGFSTDPSQAIEKSLGDKFVDNWKVGVPDKLGWSLTAGAADYASTKTRFIAASSKSGFIAWFGHGQYSLASKEFIGLDMFRVPGFNVNSATMLTADSLPAGLDCEFVFINSCGSATPGNAAASALITKLNSKLYIGWDNLANLLAAAQYADNLLRESVADREFTIASDASWRNVDPILKFIAPGRPVLVWRPSTSDQEKSAYRINKKRK